GLKSKPESFFDFVNQYDVNEELNTEEITDSAREKLEQLLPEVISFADQLFMDQKQQELQYEMEKDWAVYEQKMKDWRSSKSEQLELEFEGQKDFSILKWRKKEKEREIETILSQSSQYFKDLTSLSGDAYLKILAVFYND